MNTKTMTPAVLLLSAALWGFPTTSFPFGKEHRLKDADPDFVRDADNPVVLDTKRSLVYYDGSPSAKLTFEEARRYCAKLDVLGERNWRVPTKAEMRSLINNKRRGEPTVKYAFRNVLEEKYWSSTGSGYGKAWYFDFDLGRYGKRKMSERCRTLCVTNAD